MTSWLALIKTSKICARLYQVDPLPRTEFYLKEIKHNKTIVAPSKNALLNTLKTHF